MKSDASLFKTTILGWIFFQVVSIATAQEGGGDYAGIHVSCTPQYMQLALERVHYEKIDPASLHLTDPNCKTSFHNDTLMIIRAPLGGCGTQSAKQNDLLAFRNEVYAEVIGHSGSITRLPAYRFILQCMYYTTAKISLHPFKAEDTIIINPNPGFGFFEFESSMFQTDKYISKFTQFPVKVHIGESIYLQVNVKSNATGLSLLLDNCRATPSQDPNDTVFYTLIKNGCPVDKYLNYKNSDSPYQRFSFQSFQMNNADVIYLHCDVYVCAKDTNSSRCAEGCVQGSGNKRRRRDETNQSQQKGVTSLGPLEVLMDRLNDQPQGPVEGGSRSDASLVKFDKLAILMTFTLAWFLAM